jgi:hypothetical protein
MIAVFLAFIQILNRRHSMHNVGKLFFLLDDGLFEEYFYSDKYLYFIEEIPKHVSNVAVSRCI